MRAKNIMIKFVAMVIVSFLCTSIYSSVKSLLFQQIAMTQLDNPSQIAMTIFQNGTTIDIFSWLILVAIWILVFKKEIQKLIKGEN